MKAFEFTPDSFLGGGVVGDLPPLPGIGGILAIAFDKLDFLSFGDNLSYLTPV